jgi:D-tyrosyl-tRNA(Tyr) deacylase
MKALLQRVSQASVDIGGVRRGTIEKGLLLFLGIEKTDNAKTAFQLASKILKYRLFADPQGKMNFSLLETGGGLLVISQFTLVADTQKGLRPSFSNGAAPDLGKQYYEDFIAACEFITTDAQLTGSPSINIQTGQFGADMQVSLINDGPVTFLISQ